MVWSLFRLAAYGVNESLDNVSSIFNDETYLDGKYLDFILRREPVEVANFKVLPLINETLTNNESFARFGIRNLQSDDYIDDDGYITINRDTRLIIETEPVPEQTTIFGSAIGLCLGGWFKRKKSSQQNKTTSQH